ncbi:MAG TPA: CDP-alcohol phosphatidyltransferase family protein [Ferruginibacter sp.]|nr:CDP-alcohol phosphatidyltransferase family protein [Chitinophagaceae bacterium]HQW92067.1 CDP-alcohol phosphatidyltransferase family protein [Ferruginibacter sp.]
MSTHKKAWYVINGITLYRVIAAPFLLVLLFTGRYELFKWLLGLSFFTDLIDGFLARKFKVTSVAGTRLDSIGDDLTILVAMTGLFVMKPEFIKQEKIAFIILLALFLVQTIYAFIRYGKMTSFHTWLAKAAAIFQGVFLLLVFFTGEPNMILFYTAVLVTMLELIEEIILVYLLPVWETDVKGIYRLFKKKKQASRK